MTEHLIKQATQPVQKTVMARWAFGEVGPSAKNNMPPPLATVIAAIKKARHARCARNQLRFSQPGMGTNSALS